MCRSRPHTPSTRTTSGDRGGGGCMRVQTPTKPRLLTHTAALTAREEQSVGGARVGGCGRGGRWADGGGSRRTACAKELMQGVQAATGSVGVRCTAAVGWGG